MRTHTLGIVLVTLAIYKAIWNVLPPKDEVSIAIWILLFLPSLPVIFLTATVLWVLIVEAPISLAKTLLGINKKEVE